MATLTRTETVSTNAFTASLYDMERNLVDAFFNANPVLAAIRGEGQIKKTVGRAWEPRIETTENPNAKAIGEGEELRPANHDFMRPIRIYPRTVACGIMKYRDESDENMGKAQWIDLSEAKIRNMVKTMRRINEQFACSSNDSETTKFPSGIQHVISTTPTTGTLHDLSRATETYWRNHAYDMDTEGAFSSAGVKTLEKLEIDLMHEGLPGSTLLIICDKNSFILYRQEANALIQLTNLKVGDTVFRGYTFNGHRFVTSPKFDDIYTNDWSSKGRMYVFKPSELVFVQHAKRYFRRTGWKELPYNVDDSVMHISTKWTLGTTNPRGTGVIFDIA